MKLPRILPLFCVVAALFVSGCREATQQDVEKAIRDGMKKKMDIEVTSLELKKKPEGNHRYVGTATAQNGDVYDVFGIAYTREQIDWGACPVLAQVEKQLRTELEQKFKEKVKSMQLSKEGGTNYSGLAELADGRN